MSQQLAINMDTLRRALEQRDIATIVSLYADNAEMSVIDCIHKPSSPLELHGKNEIAAFLNDICTRDMTHQVLNEVEGKERIAFHQACQYPGGERVLAASTLDLKDGKIVRQTTVQAWDE